MDHSFSVDLDSPISSLFDRPLVLGPSTFIFFNYPLTFENLPHSFLFGHPGTFEGCKVSFFEPSTLCRFGSSTLTQHRPILMLFTTQLDRPLTPRPVRTTNSANSSHCANRANNEQCERRTVRTVHIVRTVRTTNSANGSYCPNSANNEQCEQFTLSEQSEQRTVRTVHIVRTVRTANSANSSFF